MKAFTIISSFRITGLVMTFFACGLILSSCGGGEKNIQAPEGMSSINLSAYGKPFVLFVPDTTKTPLLIQEESSGMLVLRSGKSFYLGIMEEKADLELKRSDISSDEVNKFARYISEEPDAICWESAIAEPEFHFLMNRNLGGRDFCFQDLQDPEIKTPDLNAIKRIFESCKSAVAVEIKP